MSRISFDSLPHKHHRSWVTLRQRPTSGFLLQLLPAAAGFGLLLLLLLLLFLPRCVCAMSSPLSLSLWILGQSDVAGWLPECVANPTPHCSTDLCGHCSLVCCPTQVLIACVPWPAYTEDFNSRQLSYHCLCSLASVYRGF